MSEPGTSGIEQSVVSTKEYVEKPADGVKPAKNVQNPGRGKQVPQTEGKLSEVDLEMNSKDQPKVEYLDSSTEIVKWQDIFENEYIEPARGNYISNEIPEFSEFTCEK
ncbi:hypothetical protein JTB14_010935 [Gonioctena quinquepunctata]|nr:hypothetical protein JTB14_010935 [Gonioctena quinquepunctata]